MTFWFSRGSITTSSNPRFLAPQAFRETMDGERVYSNCISLLMAAKKLYFIRSCSKSCKVRLLAESSLWEDIFSTMLLMDSSGASFPSVELRSSCMVSETSIRHSKSNGLKLPHSLLHIISMACSWEKAAL